MIIPIDDNQRINSNELSWNLEVLHVPAKEGKAPYWKTVKYYTSLSDALSRACSREIRLDGAEGLVEAFAAATRISEKYSRVFDGYCVSEGQNNEPN